MFNRIRFLTITLAVCGVGSASAYAQMASLERDLASHGITDLSERSLIASLSDKDPHVRTVAAMKLAEDHYDDAAPAIKSALSREQDVNAQIGLS